jgi:HEAT repeat protein
MPDFFSLLIVAGFAIIPLIVLSAVTGDYSPLVYGTVLLSMVMGLAYWAVRRQWTMLAIRLGLSVADDWTIIQPKLQGYRDGFEIRIMNVMKSTPLHKEVAELSLVLDGLGQVPPGLSLSRERRFARTKETETLTGDTAFDRKIRVHGADATALALLDSTTRELVLRHVVQDKATVKGGRLMLPVKNPRHTEQVVGELLELGQRLRDPKQDVAARLAANALHDPQLGVQLRNYEVLLALFAEDEITLEVSRKLLASPQERLCLEAAISLAAEGIEMLCELARHASTDELRVRAIEHLTRASWAERVIPVLEHLLKDPSIPVLKAAITAIGQFRHRPAMPQLLALLHPGKPQTAVVIVKALVRIGDPVAEEGLLPLLSSNDSRVLAETVEALAILGSRLAIEPLLKLARRGRGRTLEKSIKQAVERIQGKLPGAEHGQLSVVETAGHEGGLSPAGHDGGLSPAEESVAGLSTDTRADAG